MCVSLERLFCLTSQQAISVEPRASGKGIFSREDAAGVIAMVQHVHPVGVKLLEAKIGGNQHSAAELKQALSSVFESRNVNQVNAKALATMAVTEVCGIKKCPHCKGTGFKDYRHKCRNCKGSGVADIRTIKNLTATFNALSRKTLTEQQFSQIYYDVYMSVIDELYQHESEAAKYAASVLRLVQAESEVMNG
ncbi:TIGR02642 family protein [Shewanella oncorhynchi]|uniref:TIGR02642 family protein n=1 Tax=Shewanella oncorhynchi TaxID=2726434 RepID=UPI003D7A4C1D